MMRLTTKYGHVDMSLRCRKCYTPGQKQLHDAWGPMSVTCGSCGDVEYLFPSYDPVTRKAIA